MCVVDVVDSHDVREAEENKASRKRVVLRFISNSTPTIACLKQAVSPVAKFTAPTCGS